MKSASMLVLLGSTALLAANNAKDQVTSPQAAARSYGQNYKDMLLAMCIAEAYRGEPAAVDAGSSATALRDWTYYDMETSPDAIKAVIEQYLRRDYYNPLADAEIKGIKFDLLKCFDMYHGKELDAQVKRFVIHPNHTYRQDNPPSKP